MSVSVHITEGPLPPEGPAASPDGRGATLVFEGVVRPSEEEDPITALDYEAYEPMASKMLHRLGEEVVGAFGLLALSVEHSVGRIAVGERSFRLRVVSYHRKEALAATDAFIDRLKQDVPIWKTAVPAARRSAVDGGP